MRHHDDTALGGLGAVDLRLGPSQMIRRKRGALMKTSKEFAWTNLCSLLHLDSLCRLGGIRVIESRVDSNNCVVFILEHKVGSLVRPNDVQRVEERLGSAI